MHRMDGREGYSRERGGPRSDELGFHYSNNPLRYSHSEYRTQQS